MRAALSAKNVAELERGQLEARVRELEGLLEVVVRESEVALEVLRTRETDLSQQVCVCGLEEEWGGGVWIGCFSHQIEVLQDIVGLMGFHIH